MKQKMVRKLNSVERKVCSKRQGPTTYGKPQFPTIPDGTGNDLSVLVGEDSWSFFHCLKLDKAFLELPVSEWESSSSFQAGKAVINSLCVVNDGAERGVKLTHDFLAQARKENNFQNILQVVENDRHAVPNQRKRKQESKAWFLHLG